MVMIYRVSCSPISFFLSILAFFVLGMIEISTTSLLTVSPCSITAISSIGDKSLLLPSIESHHYLFVMHLSTPSPPESTNDMILTDDETAEELSADEVAIIFGFLSPYDIMRARVCTTWRDAAKKTVVPPSLIHVEKLCVIFPHPLQIYDVRSYNAVRAMSTALNFRTARNH